MRAVLRLIDSELLIKHMNFTVIKWDVLCAEENLVEVCSPVTPRTR